MDEEKKQKRRIGSYKWRGPDSLWLSVRGGVDSNNKPVRHTKTVKGIKEGDITAADKALAIFIADIEKGKHKKPSKITLRQLSERFLRDNADLSEPTKENYKIHLNKRILPALGDNKIDKIKPAHIYDFMDNLKEDGMHPNSVDSWFSKFKKKNNLPDNLTFHGLRHTNITQLLKSGVDVGTVADNSGHARKSTTLDYDDPDAEALREVANKINNALDLENIIPNLINHPVNIYHGKRGKTKKSPEDHTGK